MGKTVRDLDPEDTKGAMDAIEGTYSFSNVPYNTPQLYSTTLNPLVGTES
jgi:hypothetical protein